MSSGILRVPGAAAPERVVCGFNDDRARSAGLFDDFINFRSRANIVAERQASCAGSCNRESSVVADALARPESETRAGLQLNEHNCSIREVLSGDALGGKTQAIPTRAQRCLKVADTEGNHCDARLHAPLAPAAQRPRSAARHFRRVRRGDGLDVTSRSCGGRAGTDTYRLSPRR